MIECLFGLEIIFMVSLHHATKYLLAVINKNMLKYKSNSFVTHISDRWVLLHQYADEINILMCSSIQMCYDGLEIIFIVILHYITHIYIFISCYS